MHPPVHLVDDQGAPATGSGRSLGAAGCGGPDRCHDVGWIQKHSYHSTLGADHVTRPGGAPSGRPWDFGTGLYGRWDPIAYDLVPYPSAGRSPDAMAAWLRTNGWRLVGGGPFADDQAGGLKDNCVLCHVRGASNDDRVAEIEAGRAQRATAATLIGTGLVMRDGDDLSVDARFVDSAGRADRRAIAIGRPTIRACGFCHGVVHEGDEPVSLARFSRRQRATETTGLVFSAQRLRDSAINIAGKEDLPRPWDVHAERLLSCSSCHFSPNHPAYSYGGPASTPAHLTFDARRVEIDDYLRRPDHDLASGSSHAGAAIRRCEACHDAAKTHAWLPRAEQHFAAMLCESCHVPAAYAPARQETDFTMLARPGEERVVYRGIAGGIEDPNAFVEGFRPVLLPRAQPDGTSKLAPYNLVTTWFWIETTDAGPRPVARAKLTEAFFVGTQHHPDLAAVLDRDANGRLDENELVLDTESKATAARARLLAVGVKDPRMSGEIQPYAMHHGVAPGAYATRRCSACHSRTSRIVDPFVVAGRPPHGVVPTLVGDADVTLPGPVEPTADGTLVLRADVKALRLHVFGLSRNAIADLIGALLVLGAIIGALGHGGLRVLAARRRNGAEDAKP
jgi:hypothetical protein